MFLEISQNSQENNCARDSFLMKLIKKNNFIKKESLALVFSSEFCEISKNTFFTEHLQTAASEIKGALGNSWNSKHFLLSHPSIIYVCYQKSKRQFVCLFIIFLEIFLSIRQNRNFKGWSYF